MIGVNCVLKFSWFVHSSRLLEVLNYKLRRKECYVLLVKPGPFLTEVDMILVYADSSTNITIQQIYLRSSNLMEAKMWVHKYSGSTDISTPHMWWRR
jgi:hypothetical protein